MSGNAIEVHRQSLLHQCIKVCSLIEARGIGMQVTAVPSQQQWFSTPLLWIPLLTGDSPGNGECTENISAFFSSTWSQCLTIDFGCQEVGSVSFPALIFLEYTVYLCEHLIAFLKPPVFYCHLYPSRKIYSIIIKSTFARTLLCLSALLSLFWFVAKIYHSLSYSQNDGSKGWFSYLTVLKKQPVSVELGVFKPP